MSSLIKKLVALYPNITIEQLEQLYTERKDIKNSCISDNPEKVYDIVYDTLFFIDKLPEPEVTKENIVKYFDLLLEFVPNDIDIRYIIQNYFLNNKISMEVFMSVCFIKNKLFSIIDTLTLSSEQSEYVEKFRDTKCKNHSECYDYSDEYSHDIVFIGYQNADDCYEYTDSDH